MKEEQSMDDQFVANIHQYIDDNYSDENFSVDDLARIAGISRSMLHRKLIKLCGKSATELITEKRLIRAKDLLEKGVATVAEIAYDVGFSSPSYFNRTFKKYYHVSPGEVRKGIPVVSTPQNKTGKRFPGKIKKPAFIVFTLLCIVIATIAGYTYFTEKRVSAGNSIAILPFDNLGSDDETQYFADGMVEDLLTRLSTLDNLKVISRTSSEMFRNKGNKTVPEIAKILGVNYIVEGSVQMKNENIRISIQLIDAKNDDHILSKQYNRNLKDVFKVQSEIAQQIVAELSIALTDRQLKKLKQNYTQNSKAFELYQLGRFHSNKRTAEGYKKGIGYYEKAITEDPGYGLAYAGLADNYSLMALQGHIDKTEGNTIAKAMVKKALEIDPGLSEAHTVLGCLYTYTDWNWKAAEKEFKKAITLNPNYSTAHQYYAEYLAIMGRNDEARMHINKALELDPLSFVIRWCSSTLYLGQGYFKEALAENRLCEDLVKDHEWSINIAYRIYIQMGNDQAAFDNLKRYAKKTGAWNVEVADSIFNSGGLKAVIRWRLDTGKYVPEYNKAFWYAVLGENEKAMDMLELAFEAHAISLMSTTFLEYKSLRSNPRFIVIRKKMGLPPP